HPRPDAGGRGQGVPAHRDRRAVPRAGRRDPGPPRGDHTGPAPPGPSQVLGAGRAPLQDAPGRFQVNDVDRWINLEGPEPPLIREPLHAARDVPDLTPEQAESMDHALRAALAAQRRRWARERSMKVALAAGLFAAGAAAALSLVLRCAAPADPTLVHE